MRGLPVCIATVATLVSTNVFRRVAAVAEATRKEGGNKPPRILYQPPELSDTLKYIYSARHEIEKKVRHLVLSHGGGGAGSSMAGFDIYLDNAFRGNIISPELFAEITDFFIMYTQPTINFEETSEELLKEIQYLAAHINHQLDSIASDPMME